MALPALDNHDPRIRYYELMLEGELSGIGAMPLPPGYHYEMYRPGDRDAWIEIERSAKELDSLEQGIRVWAQYYGGHEAEMPERMVFLATDDGEKVGTATAFYDVRGIDQSGDAWLHWVAIKREHQGKGLSKPMITHVIQLMKGLGYTRAKIPTQTTTWVACKVYLDLGFKPIEKNYIRNRDGWRIVKRLTDHEALSALEPAGDMEILRETGD